MYLERRDWEYGPRQRGTVKTRMKRELARLQNFGNVGRTRQSLEEHVQTYQEEV